jgi:hypothetical protein
MWVPHKKIITVYCENRTKHTNTLGEQNVAGGMYSYHCTIRDKSCNPGSYCKEVEVNNCWPCICPFRSLTSKRLVPSGESINILSCFKHISCRLDGPRLESDQGEKIVSFPKRLFRRWDPPVLLFSGYRGSSLSKSVGACTWPLTSMEYQLWEWADLYLYSPICLNDVGDNFTLLSSKLYK